MAEYDVPGAGEVCWRELRTRDLPMAIDFYSKLFGWTLEQSKTTEMNYLEIVHNGRAIGGLMAIDESWGPEPPPSHWAAYIAVENADETSGKITASGGTVKVPAFDAPGVGRIVMAADPSGADLAVIQFVEQG